MRSWFLAGVTFLTLIAFDCRATVGHVTKRSSVEATTYLWHGVHDEILARARRAVVSWGTRLDVFDEKGRLLGTVTEERVRTFRGLTTLYSVFDIDGRQVAESARVVWPKGSLRWNAAPTGIDQRVLAMLDAYLTDVATERSAVAAH